MSDLYGRISGTGHPVVLLHGFCETHHIWDELVQKLVPDYKVLCPDLPGFGDSPLRHKDFSLELIADNVKDWLQAHDISGSTMIGHSLGGYVTLAFAKKYPEMIKKIGLFHSSAYADDEQKKASRNKTIDFIKAHGVEAFVDSFFQNLFYTPNLDKPYIREKLKTISDRARLLKVAAVNGYLAAMRDREDSRTWLIAFTRPVLMISGTDDNAVPIVLSREQAKLSPNIDYHELAHTGHMGMFERGSEAFRIIRQFLLK